eukprot:4167423-Pleurochrysis_carterae.AAC.2
MKVRKQAATLALEPVSARAHAEVHARAFSHGRDERKLECKGKVRVSGGIVRDKRSERLDSGTRDGNRKRGGGQRATESGGAKGHGCEERGTERGGAGIEARRERGYEDKEMTLGMNFGI